MHITNNIHTDLSKKARDPNFGLDQHPYFLYASNEGVDSFEPLLLTDGISTEISMGERFQDYS